MKFDITSRFWTVILTSEFYIVICNEIVFISSLIIRATLYVLQEFRELPKITLRPVCCVVSYLYNCHTNCRGISETLQETSSWFCWMPCYVGARSLYGCLLSFQPLAYRYAVWHLCLLIVKMLWGACSTIAYLFCFLVVIDSRLVVLYIIWFPSFLKQCKETNILYIQ